MGGMSPSIQFVVNQLIPSVRREVRNGRRFLVAPASIIVPGVLPGSKGALYYPPSECARNVSSFDGIPITLNHPSHPLTNDPVPAKTQGVWDRQGLGVIRNTEMNGKLRSEAWFDEERTRNLAAPVYQALVTGQAMEVSTGLFTDNQPMKGVHNGRSYDFIARNYRPDHLAVLPNDVGACSVADGCGLNVNLLTANATGLWLPDGIGRSVYKEEWVQNPGQPPQARGAGGQFGQGAINPQQLRQAILDSISNPDEDQDKDDEPPNVKAKHDAEEQGKGPTKNQVGTPKCPT